MELSRNEWPINPAESNTALAWRNWVVWTWADDSNTTAMKEDKLNLKGKKDDVIKAGT